MSSFPKISSDPSQPIIKSLLDIDFYKLTMGQLVFRRYRDLPVKYKLINRTKDAKIALKVPISDIEHELDYVRTLGITASEYRYLKGINLHRDPLFTDDYIQFLRDLRMPNYRLSHDGFGQYELEFSGPWAKTIYWETLALSIINELYNRYQNDWKTDFEREAEIAEGKVRLAKKVTSLKNNPDIQIVEFGTRRRYSRSWQSYVLETLAAECKRNLVGTSNVRLAMDLDLEPMGTMAHELFMVLAAYNSDSAAHQMFTRGVCDEWFEMYGPSLSIMLTDTFGSEQFFAHLPPSLLKDWRGFRQDSGLPMLYGRNLLALYERYGIDPSDKTVVFSDGLEMSTIYALSAEFSGPKSFKPVFGWGTNLTNDLGNEPLSLVVKVVEANGKPCVKLSDNPAKATGDPKEIERYKKIFGYTAQIPDPCRY